MNIANHQLPEENNQISS